ncbi:MAG: hypothetical protein JKY53_14735 [Flavobacteriales bacterium]|nr:hypothetical protein [Flavobacteriales bacterium]
MSSREGISYNKWKSEFKGLDDEIDNALTIFLQNRTCKCRIDECRHFKNERKVVFGDRIDELYNKRLIIGLSTVTKVINQN